MNVTDLFAGPGGWDVGARALGLDPLGIEWDDAACATRRAAGLRTVQADVAALNPTDYPCDLLIASPPCTSFSMAGKGKGRDETPRIVRCMGELAAGIDSRATHAAECDDKTTMLVVEPLRWALALRPRWIALEQVPPVLPLWEHMASLLNAHGWRTWTGVLSSERYGVAQTRKRAMLLADRETQPHPPVPTHHAFTSGQPAQGESADLFGGGLQPWISMSDALGWNVDCPAPTVTAGGGMTGGPEVFGRGGRARIASHEVKA